MFPAQTSLIPAQVALTRFLEQGGSALGNYPYWYLGTTPLRYLTGPILPTILIVVHRLLPNFSLFEIMFGFLALCWTLGGVGVYFLVRELGGETKLARASSFFYLFGPIVPFLFRFSDGLYLITFSFLPFILLLYLKLLKKWSRGLAIALGMAISFLILLDSLIIPILVLGMVALLLAYGGWKRLEVRLRQTILIFLFSFLISTLWYTPGYWFVLLGAPSLSGKGVTWVIMLLGKLLPTALAFAIAIFSVKVLKKRNLLCDFCFYWIFIFGFLTLIRFLSDPDFWLDWIAYGTELQLGIAMGVAQFIARFNGRRINSAIPLLTLFYLLSFIFIFNRYVLGAFRRGITQTVEYRIGQKLSEIVKPGERVFLSGTTAFWLNAFFDLSQVRGGKDQVAVHSTWREAAWEIREGQAPHKSVEWLEKLEVDYLVVHTEESEEFYHDFSFPEKFESFPYLKKTYEEKGDRIYEVLEL